MSFPNCGCKIDRQGRERDWEQGQRQNQTGADQATPAPVPSWTSLGVVIHTAMRQATQRVMKYIARKTTKLVYPPHWYSMKSPTRYANTSPAATRANNQMIRAILIFPPVRVAPDDQPWTIAG